MSVKTAYAEHDCPSDDYCAIYQSVLGPSVHISSQEPYYYDTCYDTLNKAVVIPQGNLAGSVTDVFPEAEFSSKRYKKVKSKPWSCYV